MGKFWNLSPQTGAKLGVSAVFGPNASGPDGRTTIFGGDLKVRWRPANHFRGWPFLLWQSEIMQRNYKADSFDGIDANGNPFSLPRQTLYDWGCTRRPSTAFTMAGQPVCASNTPVAVGRVSRAGTMTRFAIPATGCRHCLSGIPQNFYGYVCNTTMTVLIISHSAMLTRCGSG